MGSHDGESFSEVGITEDSTWHESILATRAAIPEKMICFLPVEDVRFSRECEFDDMLDFASLTATGNQVNADITFSRLYKIQPNEIIAHMSDPRVAEHMPLLTFEWDEDAVAKFVETKEESWRRDGLGHWAILANNKYVGWGGFQKEGDEWDYGLVLKPDSFGLGIRISKKAIAFAFADPRIPFVTFLLPPTRKHLGALNRLGATFVGESDHQGSRFLKYRLETQ